jgi:hypothetical protein
MPDDAAPFCIVTRVDLINGACANVCYSVNGLPQSRIRVYRSTWASHPGYWPPGVGDVIDPKFGTLKLRPRS